MLNQWLLNECISWQGVAGGGHNLHSAGVDNVVKEAVLCPHSTWYKVAYERN